jgi:hypothetical protein
LKHRRVFLELFSGSGALSRAVERHGIGAVRVDIRDDPLLDLTDVRVFKIIKGWIASGLIAGIWSGTPCGGLSRARHGPPGGPMPRALRSPDQVRGLPPHMLCAGDRQALKTSNLLADRAGALLRLARKRGIPGGEENPHSSYLWNFPDRQRFVSDQNTHAHCVDYCAFGRPFRARTRLMVFNMSVEHTDKLRCHGRGICSFSSRPHVQLVGTAQSRGFMTKQKSEYPPQLCQLLARSIVTAYTDKRTVRLWNLMR